MQIQLLKGKIHRATVTQAELDYVGSITLDKTIMEAAGIREYELVHIVNINNGARFETYVIAAEHEKGIVCLNGAAARMVQKNDKIIIMAYCMVDEKEAHTHQPKVVLMGENNEVEKISSYEKHGKLI